VDCSKNTTSLLVFLPKTDGNWSWQIRVFVNFSKYIDLMVMIAPRAIAWGLVSAAAFLTVGPREFRPYTGVQHHLEHFLAFALVGFAFGFVYPRHRWIMAPVAVAIGAVLEITQLWVPHRHASFSDFAVNVSAACVGLASAAVFDWLRLRYTK
jgi:VanZ family protein